MKRRCANALCPSRFISRVVISYCGRLCQYNRSCILRSRSNPTVDVLPVVYQIALYDTPSSFLVVRWWWFSFVNGESPTGVFSSFLHLLSSDSRHDSKACFSTSSGCTAGATSFWVSRVDTGDSGGTWLSGLLKLDDCGSIRRSETEEAGTVISEFRFDFFGISRMSGCRPQLNRWRKYLTKGRSPGTQAVMMMTFPSMLRNLVVSDWTLSKPEQPSLT